MLESELAAAAAGGVTSLVCPPDTDPPLDEPGLVEMLKFRARKLSRCRLFPLGALTRGLAGEVLTEMAELTEAGCVGFSQAEVPVADTLVLQRALQYAATFGYTVWLRPQDRWLGNGVAASGAVATRLGLSGVPVAAETVALHTIFELVRATGARVHLCRLSSAAGVALLRAAKAEGLPVTADVSINSLHLTDVDIGYFNPAMRLTPPLRQRARPRRAARRAGRRHDRRAGLRPHAGDADEKTLPFAEAEPGATGLELLLEPGPALGRGQRLPAGNGRWPCVTQAPVRGAGRGPGLAGRECRPPGRGRRGRRLRLRPRRALAGAPERAAQPGHAHALCLRAQRLRAAGPRARHPGGRHGGLRGASRPDAASRRRGWRAAACRRAARPGGCCALLHGLHGLLIVLLYFPALRRGGAADAHRLVVGQAAALPGAGTAAAAAASSPAPS